jgi:hypothetical protein
MWVAIWWFHSFLRLVLHGDLEKIIVQGVFINQGGNKSFVKTQWLLMTKMHLQDN